MSPRRQFKIELLPHERKVIQKWNCTPEIQDQLTPFTASDAVSTVTLTGVDMMYLTSDLNHAIVKRGARGDDVFELSERLEFIERTNEGKLDAWYW